MSVDDLRELYGIQVGSRSTPESNADTSNDYLSKTRSKRKRRRDYPEEVNEGEQNISENQNKRSEDLLDALQKSDDVARKTLASRPFLLFPSVKLREYQQIGLNWLVSLQCRRLNGKYKFMANLSFH